MLSISLRVEPSSDVVLVVPVSAGDNGATALSAFAGADAIARDAAQAARFTGEPGTMLELFLADPAATRRVLLVGIGKGEPTALETAGGAVTARLLTSGETTASLDGVALDAVQVAAFAVGARLRSWRHDDYRTRLPAKSRPSLVTLEIVVTSAGLETTRALLAARDAVVDGIAFARRLVAEPANVLYPESFVERARAELEPLGVGIEVLDDAAMAAEGMGALLGVAQGSERPARLLVMTWAGATADPVAFVGKGVTFDTGGISLKPGAGMEDMKWDMGGAGAVAGAMKALALRKAKAHVIGVCGLVENMPDGKAQRPGDVVTSMSGQTIEVINTDAEGRLVLADVITWVQRRKGAKTIIDLATLTGAMIVALGHEYGGLFANDDALADALLAAGRASGDKLWRLPMGDVYDKLLESPIADMKNVGPRDAGSISAAQFILRFVEEGVRWAHCDIAGMVWAAKAGPLWDKGATGYGVRLLDSYVADVLEA